MSELDTLFQDLESINEERRELEMRERGLRKIAVDKCKILIAQFGLTENELFSSSQKGKGQRAGCAVPYYFNPENPQQTCGKLGRKPAWFQKALTAGFTADDLMIR